MLPRVALLICFLAFTKVYAESENSIVYTNNVIVPFGKKIPYEIDLGNTNEVEVKLIHKMGFIMVETQFGKEKPVMMMIDTGADASILSKKIIKMLQIDPISTSKQTIITTRNKAEIDTSLYIVEDIKIGSAHIKHAPFITSNTATDDFEMLADLGVEGIIGSNFFHDLIMTLDLPHSKLILSKQEQKKGHHIPMNEEYYLPVITSRVVKSKDSQTYQFLIDTGYTGFVKMPICFPESQKSVRKQVVAYDVFNQPDSGFISELNGNLEIGDKVIENPLVKYTLGECRETQRWGLIGSGYLKFQAVSIDQRRREVIIH